MLKALRWRTGIVWGAHGASRAASRLGGVGYLSALRNSYALLKRHGFQPDEAARLGLLAQPDGVENRYVSKRHLVARQRVLNAPSFQELTEDKALFYSVCVRQGLPVPRLLGIFLRGASGLRWPSTPLAGDQAWVEFFERGCPDEFVVKPSRGVYGEGILFLDRRQPGFSSGDLVRQLYRDTRYSSYVVQECLQNHPDLLALSPARGLQTLRVITYVDDEGCADVLMAYLKPIGGDNRVDNHNSGRTGNFLCPIDVATGTLGRLMMVTAVGVQELAAHPASGASLEGRPTPLWNDVCDLARSLALAFLPMRAVGWDIGLTPSGPVCVEGNARWDPPKFGDVTPLRRVLYGTRTGPDGG